MRNIIISDGVKTITMPPTRKISVGGKEESRSVQMASGHVVKEIIGFRAVVTAEWDWVPADKMRDLHLMLRRGGFFTVTYPDPVEGVKTGTYSVDRYPGSSVFRFLGDGTAVWRNVSLTFTAQEVE